MIYEYLDKVLPCSTWVGGRIYLEVIRVIGVITDTIKDESVFNYLRKYRLVILISTKHRATSTFGKVKRMLRGLNVQVISLKLEEEDEEIIERVGKAIGLEFAEHKEPIDVWLFDKCVGY